MANQFASTSTASNILKIYYENAIRTQFNDQIPLYRDMEKASEKWNGLQVNKAIKVRRNGGIGATGDGALLPKIGQQTTQQAVILAKFNYLRFGITGPLIKASQGQKGAIVNGLTFEMEEGMKDLKSDVNRQLFFDGSGTLATVSANATASNTISVTGRESTEDGNKFLDVGMVIDIMRGTTVVASALNINGLTGTTTATLTLDQQVTTVATDTIVRSGAAGLEVQGLLTSQDGGTSSIFSIDRSVYPVFQGNSFSAAGGQLTLNLMKQPFNAARRRGNGKISIVYCDYDSERFYEKLLIADKRYVGRSLVGDGTFANKGENYLEYAGCPVVPDKDCPTRFFFLDMDTWKKYVLCELEWSDEWGATLIPQSSADAFEARLRLFFNMFCEMPAANGVLKSYISP